MMTTLVRCERFGAAMTARDGGGMFVRMELMNYSVDTPIIGSVIVQIRIRIRPFNF
jgi:hypothetical protein